MSGDPRLHAVDVSEESVSPSATSGLVNFQAKILDVEGAVRIQQTSRYATSIKSIHRYGQPKSN